VARFEQEAQEARAAIRAVYDTVDPGANANRRRLLDDLSPEMMRAKLVGRWPSGQKLTDLPLPLPTVDPGAEFGSLSDLPQSAQAIKPQEFDGDKFGGSCPLSSHIRKAHPRNLDEARHHRIIRRGITFGPPVADRAADDGHERGIFFLAYQASIADQFEFIQRKWLNATEPAEPQVTGAELPPDVPLASLRSPGWDPIAGIRPESPLGIPRQGQLALQFYEGGVNRPEFRRDLSYWELASRVGAGC